ncbi:pilus assembly PilX N-terminal domain-containing protein [Patescibacteria group bacterium]|nr:pilus assembly PilX N-terminal domain-containing protein [Patescibacteria group bacterium]
MNNIQQGFVALYLTLLVVFVLSGIGISAFVLTSSQQRIIQNTKASLQAYYGAEAGVEDALFRVKNSLNWSNPGSLNVLDATVTTTVTDTPQGKLVVAEGNDSSRFRRVEALYRLAGIIPEFFYGAHIGDGGLIMHNNSQVIGDVFSNGDITGNSGAIVTGTARVAGLGGNLSNISVVGDVFVDECKDADITATLNANDNDGCSFGAFVSLGTPPDPVSLPITAEEIQGWKDAAEAGGVFFGDYELDKTETASLGPQKIVGNLLVADKAVLTLTGNLWVTGNVDVKNDAQVRLDVSFGGTSGVIVADSVITLQNITISSGSGSEGSYLMYLSTNTGNPAINIKNNAVADILYTSAGWILIENNDELRVVTGYGVHLENNAVITYEIELTSAIFSSGTGGAWELVSWKEVE